MSQPGYPHNPPQPGQIQHPTAVVVRRNEPRQDRTYTSQVSERLPVIESVELAPQPVAYTSFYGVGRDSAHNWGHIWRYQSLGIADILSHAAWPFSLIKIPSALVVNMPRAGMNPLQGNPNIQQPAQQSNGSKSAVTPANMVTIGYGKLT